VSRGYISELEQRVKALQNELQDALDDLPDPVTGKRKRRNSTRSTYSSPTFTEGAGLRYNQCVPLSIHEILTVAVLCALSLLTPAGELIIRLCCRISLVLRAWSRQPSPQTLFLLLRQHVLLLIFSMSLSGYLNLPANLIA
jgi:hypothetical protein